MNIYIRYFDSEVLVETVEQALDFLTSIPDIDVDEVLEKDFRQFINGSNAYPKRYKVRGRSYFIVIKTLAKSLEEFKELGASMREDSTQSVRPTHKADVFSEQKVGWYNAGITFRRVISIPQTQKFQYVDTQFCAQVKAISIQDCYNKVIDHLRTRADIDSRSQFPSIKNRNFECVYLGKDV